jgi:hypothetical protein
MTHPLIVKGLSSSRGADTARKDVVPFFRMARLKKALMVQIRRRITDRESRRHRTPVERSAMSSQRIPQTTTKLLSAGSPAIR